MRPRRRLGAFADVTDFVAKSAENAARLAAIFHVLEHGPAGEISDGQMIAGAQIAGWHVFDARWTIGAVGMTEEAGNTQLLLH